MTDKGTDLANVKLHSATPYFLLAALLALVPVLNNKYPAQFFPAIPPFWVEVLSVFGGAFAAAMAFGRLWAILQRRDRAKTLIRQALERRHPAETIVPMDIAAAGRTVSRLVANVDEDLREIRPDFKPESLRRLYRYLPSLLEEIEKEEDALIRLGIVGAYLGEVLCRNWGWQWFFRADPALKQFSYLVSLLRKEEKEADPFAWAADLMTGRIKMSDVLKETK